MRDPNLGSVAYSPNHVPDDPAAIPMFLREELAYIAAQVRLLALGHIGVQFTAPLKPRRGDIRYADGVQWNPGTGEGMYFFNGAGAWVKLG